MTQILLWAVVAVASYWVLAAPVSRSPKQKADGTQNWPTSAPIGVLAILGAALTRSPMVLVLTVLLGWFAMRHRRRRQARRLREERETQLIAFIEEMGQRLRSGGALVSSFASVASLQPVIAQDLEPVLSAHRAGRQLEDALEDKLDSLPSSSLRLTAATIQILISSGGPAAVALDRLAETVRARVDTQAEAKAQSSQALASAGLLASLPILFAVGLMAIEPDARSFYLYSPAGGLCSLVMVALVGGGWWWMDGIIAPPDDSEVGD